MTYLELVNGVLRRLREDEASTVAETSYTKLIGELVNDAKQYVENSWDWTALRSSVDLTTVAGTGLYSLTGVKYRSEILEGLNNTLKMPLRNESIHEIRRKNLNEVAQGDVTSYAIDGADSNNDMQIRLYPVPDSVDSLTFYCVERTGDFVDDSDTTKLPANVIIQFAYAYALVERGETGGQSGAEQAIFAKAALADAITLDARKHEDELIWDYV